MNRTFTEALSGIARRAPRKPLRRRGQKKMEKIMVMGWRPVLSPMIFGWRYGVHLLCRISAAFGDAIEYPIDKSR